MLGTGEQRGDAGGWRMLGTGQQRGDAGDGAVPAESLTSRCGCSACCGRTRRPQSRGPCGRVCFSRGCAAFWWQWWWQWRKPSCVGGCLPPSLPPRPDRATLLFSSSGNYRVLCSGGLGKFIPARRSRQVKAWLTRVPRGGCSPLPGTLLDFVRPSGAPSPGAIGEG